MTKQQRRIIEKTRNKYNRTLDESVIDAGYEKWVETTEFFVYSLEFFKYHLKRAGLKGYTQVIPTWKKHHFGDNFTKLPLNITPNEILEWQTGASKSMLPMIEAMQDKKQERLDRERFESHPCYNCSGEDCACCEYHWGY